MKLLPSLMLLALFVTPAFGQGLRMPADFLPLEVGNRWIYAVTDEGGRVMGELDFAVEEYRIVSGSSFYVLTGFPFTLEGGDRIRMVRYDRQERQFMRVRDADEGPLFLADGATTEVIAADPGGSPLKFVLKTDSMALTFERGIGIIEARFQDATGVRIARISKLEGKGLGATSGASVTAVTPSTAPLPSPSDPAAPPTQVRRVETITPVTETNPRLDVSATPASRGFAFLFVVENISEKLLPFKFNSGQSYDFVVREAGSGREIWRWSRDQFFTQVIRSEAIRGNGKWTFEATWNGRDNNDQPVPPGQYHLFGLLTSEPAIQSSPVVLAIP